MTISIFMFELGPQSNVYDPLSDNVLDSVPSPQTIIDLFAALENVSIGDSIIPLTTRELGVFDLTYYLDTVEGPLNSNIIDSVPSPNTILDVFEALQYASEPFYLGSKILTNGNPNFTGDMGAYIG